MRRSKAFEESYLGRLRAKVGHELVLMPGASVLVENCDGDILFIHRTDDGKWSLPGGAAEEGQSFADVALSELHEETGLIGVTENLIPFATVSDPRWHLLKYPNGDTTHCFALFFVLRHWEGTPSADGREASEVKFFPANHPPRPMLLPSARALQLYAGFRATNRLQLS